MTQLLECPNHAGNFDCTPFCKLCGGEQEYKTELANPNIRSLAIQGRLWFDKVNGNTYHSVSISANGKWLFDIGMTYGYEDMYLHTALESLKKWGLVSEEVRSVYDLRETLDLYTGFKYCLKKELYEDTIKGKKVNDYYHKLVQIEALKRGEY
jgi:hypothetical protein